ncbi:MAG TPA: DUF488 family protein [Verrucomicrobiae bacterium]|nr:DUF488 family protein [Verrucomicrobiae bacterium]
MTMVPRRPPLAETDRDLAAAAVARWLSEIESPEDLQAALDSWEWRKLWTVAGPKRRGPFVVWPYHHVEGATAAGPTAMPGEPIVAADAEPIADRLATCSYRGFREEMGSAMRITLYPPRYVLPFPLAGQVRELAPTRAEFHVSGEAFRQRYWERLETMGVGWIERRLQALVPHGPVVLLCFEDVWTHGSIVELACHRRMLADWLERTAGWTVPELTTPRDMPHVAPLD